MRYSQGSAEREICSTSYIRRMFQVNVHSHLEKLDHNKLKASKTEEIKMGAEISETENRKNNIKESVKPKQIF